MKVLFIMDLGIPKYRDFLFEAFADSDQVDELLVVHPGLAYARDDKLKYPAKKIRCLGSNKLSLFFGLRPLIKEADVIYTVYNVRSLSCWLPVLLYPKKKWIFWGKGLGENNSNIVKKLRKFLARKADKVLVYNDRTRRILIDELNLPEEQVEAFGNTVPISNPGPAAEANERHLLYFGRVQKRKGLLELVDAFASYRKANPGAQTRLRIVGSGDFLSEVKAQVARREVVDLVDFYPGVYDDEAIKQHYCGAVAYVSPQNVGLAIVNSAAYGVPVVTVKGSQAGPEFLMLDASNAIVCDSFDELPEAFARLDDPKFLKALKVSSFKAYQANFSTDKMAECFLRQI